MTMHAAQEQVDIRGERLIDLPAVLDKTSLARSTIYRYVDRGRFPKPVYVGDAAVRWIESEVDNWIKTLPRQKSKKTSLGA